MRFPGQKHQEKAPVSEVPGSGATTPRNNAEIEKGTTDGPLHYKSLRVLTMGIIVSLGGLVFGFDTGQISGFLEMPNFLERFADSEKDGKLAFTNTRSGTIVGLLSIGTFLGVLVGGPLADRVGRRWSIVFWNLVFCVGVVIQIAVMDRQWYQVAIGRLVAGFGVGALSVLTPGYMSETAPKQVRGSLVSCYQLFITLGILIANLINFGTHKDTTALSWRLPMGIGFIWPVLMIIGILGLPESPRFEYRHGKQDSARRTLAQMYGVQEDHRVVANEIREIREKLEIEQQGSGGKAKLFEVFTGPRMAYRVILGMALQALQQLTGANFFFYYGTSIFTATGLDDSFVTAIILAAVNFGSTFGGLWVVEHFGRRRALIFGSFWMTACFLVFASVGHFALDQTTPQNTPKAGSAMIVFACLFIAGYAMTWAPIIWTVISELYPTRYRATAMGLATSSNWMFNFLISFFTPFIVAAIDYRYGYVFAACNFASAFVVYFFLCESNGRTLEEIDTMYILHVKPWKSTKWKPEDVGELVETDRLALTPSGRDIRKPPMQGEHHENAPENPYIGESAAGGSGRA